MKEKPSLSLKHFSISMQIQKEIIVIEMFQRTFLFNDLIRGHSYQGMCWPLMKRRSRLNEAKRNIFKVILSFTTLQSFYIEDIIIFRPHKWVKFYAIVIWTHMSTKCHSTSDASKILHHLNMSSENNLGKWISFTWNRENLSTSKDKASHVIFVSNSFYDIFA